MNSIIKKLVITLFLITTIGQMSVYAQPTDNENGDRQSICQFSEYDYYVSIRKMNFTKANHLFGIERDSYDSICNVEQEILQLSTLNASELRLRGLTEVQIGILKSYDGSQLEKNYQLRIVLATITVTLTKINSSSTSVKVRANWAWNSMPLIMSTNCFETAAFRWKAYNSTNNQITASYEGSGSYCKVKYYWNNVEQTTQTKVISVGSNNAYIFSQFEQAMIYGGNTCWAKTGYMVLHVIGAGFSRVEFGFGYNHGILNTPATVSLDSGLGFNYSNGYEMAEPSITINV